MARGETRFGSQRTSQVVGPSAPRRGGEVGLTRLTIEALIPGATAAAAANYGTVAIIPAISIQRDLTGASATGAVWQLTSARERHEGQGTDAGAVTLMVTLVPSGTAKAGGTGCLAVGFNLKGANDTNQDGALHATLANYQFRDGDSVAIVPAGVLTAVTGVFVQLEFKRIG